ncbi:MAG: tetratricopeptide repeat protein [Deltaproteobacteria bacterium]|nr:tetratricopeptide repeat protein [Deltaproteobacteria bacterium]
MRLSDDSRFYRLGILLAIATTVTYSNHFPNNFHFDDFHTIVNNVYIKDIRNIPLFFQDGATFSSLPTNQSYRPVVTTTLAIDYWLGGGLRPTFFFHLSTFLLFLAQGACMYILFLGIFRTSCRHEWNRPAALSAVAWYLLHPAGAETINYIIARSDSLSTLFVILSFVLFVHSPASRRFHLYLVPLAAGCLAKPIAAVFAPLLLVYVLLFEENPSWADPFRKTLPTFAFCLILLAFIGYMEPPTWVPGGASRYNYVITQPYVILRYFTTFFLPFGLSADTDWKPLATIADVRFVAGSLFVAALLGIAFVAARKVRLRPISFGILWFLITLLPTSLIPLAEVTNDHRVFLPYVGLVMAVSWTIALALARWKESAPPDWAFSRWAATGITILLAAYAYGTTQRNEVWRSEETLWRDVVRKSPENGRGLMNYGLALMGKGDYRGAEKYFIDAKIFHRCVEDIPFVSVSVRQHGGVEGGHRRAGNRREVFPERDRPRSRLPGVLLSLCQVPQEWETIWRGGGKPGEGPEALPGAPGRTQPPHGCLFREFPFREPGGIGRPDASRCAGGPESLVLQGCHREKEDSLRWIRSQR